MSVLGLCPDGLVYGRRGGLWEEACKGGEREDGEGT